MKKHSYPTFLGIAMPALLLAGTAAAQAGPRTSANYSISPESTNAGGTRATSAAYTQDGSAGLIADVATVASPAETAKHGYLGQLYEVTCLDLTSERPVVDEGASAQLAAWHLLDDATLLALPATAVLWHSDGTFPLTVNDTTGLATAAAVYQDAATTVFATQGVIPNQLTAARTTSSPAPPWQLIVGPRSPAVSSATTTTNAPSPIRTPPAPENSIASRSPSHNVTTQVTFLE